MRLRVLVVEDQEDIAASIKRVFQLLGHDVEIAMTGSAAIVAGPFDVAFVDIGLPDITGYDVVRALCAAPGGDRRVIATLSGWSQPTVVEQALAAGVDRHLVKPASLDTLRAVLALARPAGQ